MDRGTHTGALTPAPPGGRRFVFELADERDDAALRALVSGTPLGGSIQTSLRREPDYFAGVATEGPFHQVLVAREWQSGAVVGMATRSVRSRFVEGIPAAVGYLGGLRLRPDVRKGSVLARGFQALRRLHDDGRTDVYLSLITEGNDAALEALTTERAGLPRYHYLGRYLTFILPARGEGTARLPAEIRLRSLHDRELPQLLAFLETQGRDRLFFPCLQDRDIRGPAATFRDLPLDHIVCAWRDDRIVGTLAGWDQSGFKQTVIERYRGPWNWGRHLYNAVATLAKWPRFPRPGEMLRSLTLALPVVADADPRVWQALLTGVRRLPAAGRNECLALGLFERDRLVPLARRSALHTYVTRLFAVCWNPDQVRPERFAGRDSYLELGCL